jgi:hypothetical protein
MKSHVHLWQYLAEFFLEWEISQKKITEKIKTLFLLDKFVSRKSCPLRDNVAESGGAGQATDENIIWRLGLSCWITKATNTY